MQSSNALYSKILKDLQYIEYLKHLNKYGHVFNCDYDKLDYDPFNQISLKSKIVENNLRDSTNIYQRKLVKENGIAEKVSENTYDISVPFKKPPVNLASLGLKNSKLTWRKWFDVDYNNVDSEIRMKSRYIIIKKKLN
jgi:hypothetical protein